SPEALTFERHVRPILKAHCFRCHGETDDPKAGLDLRLVRLITHGGESGAAIVPGRPAESLLMERLRSGEMPPGKKKLDAADIDLIGNWLDQGAKTAQPEPSDPKQLAITDAERRHWSFQPIAARPLPKVQNTALVRTPIDRFVLAKLEARNLTFASDADRRTLIRRVSLDLTGLPPTPRQVDAFVADPRPEAYERLVDRLLAAPQHGERWARPWLDLCHYGDTDGYLTDQPRPVAWRYRQWLVNALNADLPYDQFTIEQLAGDLLPGATADQHIATGFLRNTQSNREGGADLEQYRVEQVVDRVQMVGAVWLGLTVGCARCHNHKYDPIAQTEFYQLYAFFDSADEVNIDAPLPGEAERDLAQQAGYDRRRAELVAPVRAALDALQRRWELRLLEAFRSPGRDYVWDRQWELLGLIWGGRLGEGQLEGCQIVMLDPPQRTAREQERLQEYFLEYGAVIDPTEFNRLNLSQLSTKLRALNQTRTRVTRAPAMRETRHPRPVFVHQRGDFRAPGQAVLPGTPAILPPLPSDQRPDRLALARWLVSPEHPLTARVAVNRIWQELFERPIVTTPDNFGTQGAAPTHPELLDWLAAHFQREQGWSVKQLLRLIVTSTVYRQSSHARPELAEQDPTNALLARQTPRRLAAEQIRDAALSASGLLDHRVGGPSVFPMQPASVAMEGFENKWTPSEGRDRYRRGLYTFIQRLSPFAQNITFDAPPPGRICARRERSNTPLQALTLLNDPVFVEAAEALARLLVATDLDDGQKLRLAFERCVGRPPSTRESERLMQLYQARLASLAKTDSAPTTAWTTVCSVLLNLHEFVTRD
ncbi:MAG: PSD1 and planctomycete cytochrome C domain-containing protein, partial [Isosphaeraceae bacterium]|nr:PSD1 and planctomycete cytochrome C domain-containing protein [Isosphaeraceae bacterium]